MSKVRVHVCQNLNVIQTILNLGYFVSTVTCQNVFWVYATHSYRIWFAIHYSSTAQKHFTVLNKFRRCSPCT